MAPTSETRREREAAAEAAAAREAPTVLGGFFVAVVGVLFSSFVCCCCCCCCCSAPSPPASSENPEHCSHRASRMAVSALAAFRRREASRGSRPEREASVLVWFQVFFFFEVKVKVERRERKVMASKGFSKRLPLSRALSSRPLLLLLSLHVKRPEAPTCFPSTLNAPVGNISLTNATASKRSSSKASGFLCRRWSTPPMPLERGASSLPSAADGAPGLAVSCPCAGAEASVAAICRSGAGAGRGQGRERAPPFFSRSRVFNAFF